MELRRALSDFDKDVKELTKARQARRQQALAAFAERMVGVYECFDAKLLGTTATSSAMFGRRAAEQRSSLKEGLSLVQQGFASALERFDIKPFLVEAGENFDLDRHEHFGRRYCYGDGAIVTELVKPGWILEPSEGPPTILVRAKVRAGVRR